MKTSEILSVLPSLDGIVADLIAILNSDSYTASDVSELLMLDPVLSAKIIKVANSSTFYKGKAVLSVKDAIATIGIDQVFQIVLGVTLTSSHFCKDFDFSDFWKKCLLQACIAGKLNKCCKSALNTLPSDIVFTLALISNIGELALTLLDKSYSSKLTAQATSNWDISSILTVEKDLFGKNRFELSAEIFKDWNLPDCYISGLTHYTKVSYSDNPSTLMAAILQGSFILSRLSLSDISSLEENETISILASKHELSIETFTKLVSEAQSEWIVLLDSFDFDASVDSGSLNDIIGLSSGSDLFTLKIALFSGDSSFCNELIASCRDENTKFYFTDSKKNLLRQIISGEVMVLVIDERSSSFSSLVDTIRGIRDIGPYLSIISVGSNESPNSNYDCSVPSSLGSKSIVSNILAKRRSVALQIKLKHEKEKAKLMALQLKHSNDCLTVTTMLDPLTKINNRLAFNEYFSELAVLPPNQLSLLYVDLNKFKSVNDTLGHSTGDEVLLESVNRLKSCLSSNSRLYRIGGDEFIVLTLNTDPSQVILEAKEMVSKLSDPVCISGNKVEIGACIGISFYPEQTKDISQLLPFSDLAMYVAKKSGLNDVSVFDENLHLELKISKELQFNLDKCLEAGEFYLNLQPKFELKKNAETGKSVRILIGAESLLRWNSPSFGVIPPDLFIPMAESLNLISKLGYWSLKKSCLFAKKICEFFPSFVVSVNVSAKQLNSPDFSDTVLSILKSTGLHPSSLELEITETTLIKDMEHTKSVLTKLSSFGIKFSLDDFGKGYSNFAYIQSLPIHTLKVDRQFVSKIDSNSNNEAIVAMFINMAKFLKLNILAEGVESLAELTKLFELGCSKVQGFLLSKPMSESDFYFKVKSMFKV